jgi:hypothetical protein
MHYGSLTGLIGILHEDSVCEQYAPRIMNPYSINFSVLQGWIHECANSHSEECSPNDLDQLVGFSVLDVRSRRVIKAPVNCSYVALSYVWGHHRQEHNSHDPDFPLTINDAFTVTIVLGFKYLCELIS